MSGPGEYVPDVTEGITRLEDLPKSRTARRSRNAKDGPRVRVNCESVDGPKDRTKGHALRRGFLGGRNPRSLVLNRISNSG
jgi:hypothetical protein